MLLNTLDFVSTNQFQKLFLDYIKTPEKFSNFYDSPPTIEGIETKIKNRKFPSSNRVILKTELEKQYSNIRPSELTIENIHLLENENTFTIACGHQLNLFTGPLYFIYKIISTIKLAGELSDKYPNYKFIPVYWMATEDHDFAEINHFQLFNKTYTWEQNTSGAVGRIEISEMKEFLDTLPPETEIFKKFYSESKTLAEATRKLVNHLFGEYGLIIIDADVPSLRKLFTLCIKKELSENTSFHKITKTQDQLTALGYKNQVHSREINLMYIDKKTRERIIFEDNIFKVNNTSLTFTLDEILNLADNEPEKFSTNVILRPIYQEVILPNLVFIGGPAEVAYWLELKEVFEAFNIPMPVVLPRNFALLINQSQLNKLNKYNLNPSDLFLTEIELRKLIAKNDIEISFNNENELLIKLQKNYKDIASKVDQTLSANVESEFSKIKKQLSDLEKKIQKTVEKRNSDSIDQILNIKNKLFPNDTAQERIENILNYITNNPDFIKMLFSHFEPLSYRYYIINSSIQ